MEKILKILFKDTQVLGGGYMRGPIHAPFILAIPLFIVYALLALPFFPIYLVIEIVNKVKSKQIPDVWELLGYIICGVAFPVWLYFIF